MDKGTAMNVNKFFTFSTSTAEEIPPGKRPGSDSTDVTEKVDCDSPAQSQASISPRKLNPLQTTYINQGDVSNRSMSVDENGNTPLHRLIHSLSNDYQDSYDQLRELLGEDKRSSSVTLDFWTRNDAGKTPLDLIEKQLESELADLVSIAQPLVDANTLDEKWNEINASVRKHRYFRLNEIAETLRHKTSDATAALKMMMSRLIDSSDLAAKSVNNRRTKPTADELNAVFLLLAKNCNKIENQSWRNAGVRLLISHGANPKARDHQGNTSLMLAAQAGDRAFVAQLVTKHSVDMDAKNADGYTPFMWAIDAGDFEMAEELLKKGAAHNLVDKHGHTILESMAIYGRPGNVEKLLKLYAANGVQEDLRISQHDETRLLGLVNAKLAEAVDAEEKERYNKVANTLSYYIAERAATKMKPIKDEELRAQTKRLPKGLISSITSALIRRKN